jgi:hypothetical protein
MMESRMKRNFHVRFGERYEETRQSQGRKVRFVPTPFSPLLANIALDGHNQSCCQCRNNLEIFQIHSCLPALFHKHLASLFLTLIDRYCRVQYFYPMF